MAKNSENSNESSRDVLSSIPFRSSSDSLAKGISGSYAIALRARGVSEDCYGLDKASDRLRRVGISGIEASWKRQKESRSVKSTWLGAT